MGVHGLWQLISSTGKPVPLDSLEGKILAVDVSVWLHQLAKGMRDGAGNPVPNAHIHGLFTRICKLLHCRIKPVFVFDGAAPELKKKTLSARRNKRDDAEETSALMQKKILTNLIRSQALNEALGEENLAKLPTIPKGGSTGPKKDTLYQLPPIPEASRVYLSQTSNEENIEKRELQELIEEEFSDLHSVDVESSDFKALPTELQHELIEDMKARRKNYNLSKIVEMPEDSKDFSNFQMAKLLKYNKLNTRLEEVRKELNQRQTKDLRKQYGEDYYGIDIHSQRVASDDLSHYVLIKGLKKKKEMILKGDMVRDDKKSFVVSEESSCTDELIESSDNDELKEIDFLRPSAQNVMEKVRVDKREKENQEDNKGCGIRFVEGKIDNDDRETFRPVIEIDDSVSSENDDDSDSGSSEENDVQEIHEGYKTTFSHDQDLQYAIELSLKDQNMAETKIETRGTVKSVESDNKTNDTVIHLEQQEPEQLSKVDTIESHRQSKRITRGNIKQISNTENKTSKTIDKKTDSLKYSVDKPVVLSEDKSDISKESAQLRNTDTNNKLDATKKKRAAVFKRRKSNLSNEDEEIPLKRKVIMPGKDTPIEIHDEDDQPRRTKIVDEKGDDSALAIYDAHREKGDNSALVIDYTHRENDMEESSSQSESDEDDFMEVKIDLQSVKEDDMFPASMFEEKMEVTEEYERQSESDRESPAIHPEELKLPNIGADTAGLNKDIKESVRETSESDRQSPAIPTEELKLPNIGADTAGLNKDIKDSVREIPASDNEEVGEMNEEKVDTHDEEIRENKENISIADPQTSITTLDEDKESSKNKEVTDLVRTFKSMEESNIRGLRSTYEKETKALQQEQGRQARLAASITDQMHADAQELLQLFGIPYIVSPSEAEAQCAQLNKANLTQGTITDDSDIWLFGGKVVYKNFFNQAKYVECFQEVHIRSQLGLSQEPLINIALLCGSDYTEGIQGVGPVTAMEILAEFPGEGIEGLVKFRSWWEAAQTQIKLSQESKLLSKLRTLDINPGFPCRQVVDAYLCPMVEDSTEKFSWALPDLDQLRHFANTKLGWTKEKADELLLPVLKRINYKKTQRPISSFFQPEVYIQPAKMKSKRLQKVVNQFLNPEESVNLQPEVYGKTTKARTAKNKARSKTKAENNDERSKDVEDKQEIDKSLDSNKRARTVGTTKGKGNKGKGRGKNKIDADDTVMDITVSDEFIDEDKIENTCSEMISKGLNSKRRSKQRQSVGRGKQNQCGGKGKGRGQTLKKSDDVDSRDKASKDAGTSDSDSDSDSSISFSIYTDSDDDTQVTQSSLSVAEILGLKFGDTQYDDDCNTATEDTEKSGPSSHLVRVFETGLNVEELMNLESGDKETDFNSKSSESSPEFLDNVEANIKEKERIKAVGSDTELDEFYKSEGGFIREKDTEDDSSSYDCVVTQSKDNTSEDLKKVDKDTGQSLSTKTNANGGSDKVTKPVTGDICGHTKSDRVTRGLGRKIAEKHMSSESSEIENKGKLNIGKTKTGRKVAKNSKSSDSKTETDTKDANNVTTEKNELDNGSRKVENTKDKEQLYHTTEPIKNIVSGVPWADPGRKRGRKMKGEGVAVSGSVKRHLQPMEKIEKRSKVAKTMRNPIGCVNLSESDSDSS